MLLGRDIQDQLLQAAAHFPVVVLTGTMALPPEEVSAIWDEPHS